jgi:hypothetical protein
VNDNKRREIPITERLAKMTEAERFAWIQAHPSYEAAKAANPHREPSVHEVLEHAEASAFAEHPKAHRIAHRLEALIETLDHQIKHNAPVSPATIAELKAIRADIG